MALKKFTIWIKYILVENGHIQFGSEYFAVTTGYSSDNLLKGPVNPSYIEFSVKDSDSTVIYLPYCVISSLLKTSSIYIEKTYWNLNRK